MTPARHLTQFWQAMFTRLRRAWLNVYSGTSSRPRNLPGPEQVFALRTPSSTPPSPQHGTRYNISLLVTVRVVFGPPSQKVSSISTINTSMEIIHQAIDGSWKANGIPPTIFPVYTDVRNLGIAHVKAAELDVTKGQRYLFIDGYFVCLFLLLPSPLCARLLACEFS